MAATEIRTFITDFHSILRISILPGTYMSHRGKSGSWALVYIMD